MRGLLKTAAPWSAGLAGFLGGGTLAATVVPVVLYDASKSDTAAIVFILAILSIPAGAAFGLWIKRSL